MVVKTDNQLSFELQTLDQWKGLNQQGQRGSIDAARTSTVGYLTPSGMYVSLTQSNADEQRLIGWLIASFGTDLHPTGAQNVGGVSWVVYEGGENVQPVWTTRLDGPTGPAQIAITGAASPNEFRTLAAATQSQQPLPARLGDR